MKGHLTLFALALFPLLGFAVGSQQKDNFRSLLEVRRLEERIALSEARTDLEAGAKAEEVRELSALLTQAKIERNGFLEEAGSTRGLASAPSPGDLSASFPTARALSVFEWQVLAEVFGKARQEELLRASFGIENLPPAGPGNDRILWITCPSFPILSRSEAEKEKSERLGAIKQLRALGYRVEELATNPFTRMEDLAEDLQKALRSRLEPGAAFLVSRGNASSVLLRVFDLYPELSRRKEILGWLNVNGRLFGQQELGPKKRVPSSAGKPSAADRQLLETKNEELRLRAERLERQAPLGTSFPVLSLVTLQGPHRPSENLRESLVPEGRTYFLKTGSGLRELGSALPALRLP